MALWQNDATGDRFDDGAALLPGDEGFSREAAVAHFGDGVAFSYVGTPNWAPPADAPIVMEVEPASMPEEPQTPVE